MFLSIIIPFYNDEKYLNECLDSCLDQDYPQDDYEIICVDDGSTDRTPELLQEYASKHPNIKAYFKKHGVLGRSIGYSVAKGDYIWFVDHDDIVAPNAVSELKMITVQNPEYDRILFPIYEFENEMTDDEKQRMRQGLLKVNKLEYQYSVPVWASIYSHSFMLEHDIRPRSKRLDEAAAFWGIKKFYAWGADGIFNDEIKDNGGRLLITEGRPLYHYRKNPGSEMERRDQKWLELRRKTTYNRFLLELYLVLTVKKAYEEEKKKCGTASLRTVSEVIVKLRSAMEILWAMPRKNWHEGMRLAEERQAFFKRKPPEYTFGFFQYARLLQGLDRFRPRAYLRYFLYSKTGAYLYRIALTPCRIGNRSQSLRRNKRAIRRILTHK